jgi:O-antigen/teichoic acid export membrane protein
MNVFAMDWFFQGIEKYKFITSRSIAIKVISLVMILLFIKSRQDYIIYCAILVFGTSFNNLINYMYSRKFVRLSLKNINLLKHVSKLKYLFLASVICSIYTQFDTVILGVVSTEKDVAFYSRNKQILTLCLTIPTALVQVLLPRLSFLYQNEKDRYANELKEYMNVILLIVIPLACIIGLLSEDISVFLGHEEFRQSYYGLMIISPLMIINSISGAQYSLILLPTGNENKSYQYHIIAAISSLLGTMLLGRHLGYIGACVSYLVSQLLAYLYNLFICNKVIKMKAVNSSVLKIAFSCVAPLLLLYFIKVRLSSMLLSIVVKTCCYLIIYMIILFITKEKTILYLISKMRTLVLGEKKAEY